MRAVRHRLRVRASCSPWWPISPPCRAHSGSSAASPTSAGACVPLRAPVARACNRSRAPSLRLPYISCRLTATGNDSCAMDRLPYMSFMFWLGVCGCVIAAVATIYTIIAWIAVRSVRRAPASHALLAASGHRTEAAVRRGVRALRGAQVLLRAAVCAISDCLRRAHAADPALAVVQRLKRDYPRPRPAARHRPDPARQQPQGQQSDEHDAAAPAMTSSSLPTATCGWHLTIFTASWPRCRIPAWASSPAPTAGGPARVCGRCSARSSSTSGSCPRPMWRLCSARAPSPSAPPSPCAREVLAGIGGFARHRRPARRRLSARAS